jgi:hypothetical protein
MRNIDERVSGSDGGDSLVVGTDVGANREDDSSDDA